MILKITKKTPEGFEEKEVEVYLTEHRGSICLVVDSWNVFELKPNGTGRRVSCIADHSILCTDEQGRIVLDEEIL
jgi:hypothetical protein